MYLPSISSIFYPSLLLISLASLLARQKFMMTKPGHRIDHVAKYAPKKPEQQESPK